MTDSDQNINKIPEYAKSFIQVVRDRGGKELDFCDASVARLDEVVETWQNLSQDEKSDLLDGMSYYLGEIIRRNLGGAWVDPKWENPENIDMQCYLIKVAGALTIHPHDDVRKLFCYGPSEAFSLYYDEIQQKAKTVRKDLNKELKKDNSSLFPASAPSRFSGLDRTTSILAIMQFLAVILGWVICRKLVRGSHDFLSNYGFILALIPLIWTPVMIYANKSDRTPEIFDRIWTVVGFLSIFIIFGLFGCKILAIIESMDSFI